MIRYFLGICAAFGSIDTAIAMGIFNPAGKQAPYTDGWRGYTYLTDGMYLASIDVMNSICFEPNVKTIEKCINNGTLQVNEPSLTCSGCRDPRIFYYPVEWIILHGNRQGHVGVFQTLLKYNAAVNGYPDFNPLRGILECLSDASLMVNLYDTHYKRE